MPADSQDPWWGIELLVSTVAVNRRSGKAVVMSDPQFFATALDGVSLFINEQLDKRKVERFWVKGVIPYFTQARAAGHTEAMAYHIMRSLDQPEVLEWLVAHEVQVAAYLSWSDKWRPGA